MTVDIRAAAEAESDRRYAETPFAPENELIADAFVAGAVWAQAQLTPTREQIAEVLSQSRQEKYQPGDRLRVSSHDLQAADAVLGLLQDLMEGWFGVPDRTKGAP
ncbi:hypothetical protein ICM05_01145 [Leucobacter sp. cx-42]|uniref:hypothetical protein n=1 Tax=unclassified Leucobacter TaxID=2621730 RepID=UPI00165E00D2|nr:MULTISPECIES: hypothetical protein [unclassified Leucobacter]MBC9953254.1 hypothetical protein [Leucobacter sp. cx-42]